MYGKFLSGRRKHLEARRKEKIEIIASGGSQAEFHSQKDIIRIDFALKRMNEGQYGLCTSCGCEIARARLVVIPETPFCTECATKQEDS